MALQEALNETLTRAIRAKDTRTANVVRMLKTKIQERRTAKGASGEVDDALVLDVIGAYRKQLQKALAEFEKAGERGVAQAEDLRFEIAFCEGYLPRTMDQDAVRALVRERIGALGLTDPRQAGRLVGDIMKTHKGQVEAGEVKRIADELLSSEGGSAPRPNLPPRS
ncbi:MAG TPA: GatB/YqeY domain-containing protein [Methylomirabilota bacterium]